MDDKSKISSNLILRTFLQTFRGSDRWVMPAPTRNRRTFSLEGKAGQQRARAKQPTNGGNPPCACAPQPQGPSAPPVSVHLAAKGSPNLRVETIGSHEKPRTEHFRLSLSLVATAAAAARAQASPHFDAAPPRELLDAVARRGVEHLDLVRVLGLHLNQNARKTRGKNCDRRPARRAR